MQNVYTLVYFIFEIFLFIPFIANYSLLLKYHFLYDWRKFVSNYTSLFFCPFFPIVSKIENVETSSNSSYLYILAIWLYL